MLDDCKERARTTDQLVGLTELFFPGHVVTIDAESAKKNWPDRAVAADLIRASRDRLATLEPWEDKAIETALKALATERGVGTSPLFQMIRVAVTGKSVGISVTHTIFRLGKVVTLQNIDSALQWLAQAPPA